MLRTQAACASPITRRVAYVDHHGLSFFLSARIAPYFVFNLTYTVLFVSFFLYVLVIVDW